MLWLNEPNITIEQVAEITFEKVDIFIRNSFNQSSYETIKNIVSWDQIAQTSMDDLVNQRDDCSIIS